MERTKKTNQPPETLYGMGRKHRAIKMGGKKKKTHLKAILNTAGPKGEQKEEVNKKGNRLAPLSKCWLTEIISAGFNKALNWLGQK